MERTEHRRLDHQMMLEDKRLENARQAVRNGAKAKAEDHVLVDLRKHYRVMSRGFNGARR